MLGKGEGHGGYVIKVKVSNLFQFELSDVPVVLDLSLLALPELEKDSC